MNFLDRLKCQGMKTIVSGREDVLKNQLRKKIQTPTLQNYEKYFTFNSRFGERVQWLKIWRESQIS